MENPQFPACLSLWAELGELCPALGVFRHFLELGLEQLLSSELSLLCPVPAGPSGTGALLPLPPRVPRAAQGHLLLLLPAGSAGLAPSGQTFLAFMD